MTRAAPLPALRLALALALLAAAGCPGRSTGPAGPAADEMAPAALLADWEETLATAPRLRVIAHAEIGAPYDGVVDAVLLADGARVRIDARGSFGGEPFALEWIFDGENLSSAEVPPDDVRGRVAHVVARWGLASLASMLSSAGPLAGVAELELGAPERAADGRVVVEARLGDQPHSTIHFSFDPATRLAARRDAIVTLGDDSMTDSETYVVDTAPAIPADAFALAP